MLRRLLRKAQNAVFSPLLKETTEQTRVLRSQHDFLLITKWARAAQDAKNPLNRFGAKFFSQSDEDGITLEITRRLGLATGTFLELGVGDGLETNTLVLLSLGWRGAWLGGETIAFNAEINPQRLCYKKGWVTLNNIKELAQQALGEIGVSDVDVLSVDLDGNDFYFTEVLLKFLQPKLLIVEYNGKFPPPARWTIKYNPDHEWDRTDYYGASLSAFCDLLRDRYSFVCCNAAPGVNAFFVKDEHVSYFSDVPKDIRDVFVQPQLELPTKVGHPTSSKTIEQILANSRELLGPELQP
jgi:hypothetical protein